jgi:hypothetical protein
MYWFSRFRRGRYQQDPTTISAVNTVLFRSLLPKPEPFWIRPVPAGVIALLLTIALVFLKDFYESAESSANSVLFDWGKLSHYLLGPFRKHLLDEIYFGLAALFLLYFIYLYSKLRDTLEQASKVASDIKLIEGFYGQAALAEGLSKEQRAVFSDLCSRIYRQGGGIVVRSDQASYFRQLQILAQTSRESIYLLLRGPVVKTPVGYTAAYHPKCFFDHEDEITTEEKLEYLTTIRDLKIPQKIRLLMFEDHEVDDFFAAASEPEIMQRKVLVDSMVGGPERFRARAFLVDPTMITKRLDHDHPNSDIGNLVYEDFAIFDKRIVLKHNGRSSLTIGIQGQVDLFNAVFQQFETVRESGSVDWIKEITVEKIGNFYWDEWAKLVAIKKKGRVTETDLGVVKRLAARRAKATTHKEEEEATTKFQQWLDEHSPDEKHKECGNEDENGAAMTSNVDRRAPQTNGETPIEFPPTPSPGLQPFAQHPGDGEIK